MEGVLNPVLLIFFLYLGFGGGVMKVGGEREISENIYTCNHVTNKLVGGICLWSSRIGYWKCEIKLFER